MKIVGQVCATEAQIAEYLGNTSAPGQLVWSEDGHCLYVFDGKKKGGYKVAMSGDMGTFLTKNVADETYLGIDDEAASVSWANISGKPEIPAAQVQVDWNETNSSSLSFIKNKPTIPNTAAMIPKTGDRGQLAGYCSGLVSGAAETVNEISPDDMTITSGTEFTVSNGSSGRAWCKVRYITAGVTTITLGSNWKWANGAAPEIKLPCALVCYWSGTGGIANIISGAE